jgi:hypothetical protein
VTAGEPVREECLKGRLDRFGVFALVPRHVRFRQKKPQPIGMAGAKLAMSTRENHIIARSTRNAGTLNFLAGADYGRVDFKRGIRNDRCHRVA